MITTINLKDLIKYLVGLIIVILIAIYSTRFFFDSSKNKKRELTIGTNPTSPIKYNLSIANYVGEKEKEKKEETKTTSRSGITRIFDLELPKIEQIAQEEVATVEEEDQPEEEEEKERTTTQIKETYTNTYGTVKIKNLTNCTNIWKV